MTLRITLLYLLISTALFAQNKFEKGIIQFKDGHQENGYIEYEPSSPTAILFKKAVNDPSKTINPNLVDYYSFDNFQRKFSSQTLEKSDYFLEIIIEGRASLLSLKNSNKPIRYFLKSEKSGLKELDIINRIDNRVENNGQVTQFKVKRYIGVLNLEFNDHPTISKKIKNVKLSQTSLSKIFSEYNTHFDKSTFNSEILEKKDIHRISFDIGINNTKTTPEGKNIRALELENKVTPTIGVNYTYTPSFFSSKTSFLFGIHYNHINAQGNYYRIHDVLKDKYELTKINAKSASFRLGIVYSFAKPQKRLRPSIGAYALGNFLLNSSSAYVKVDANGNESELYEGFNLSKQGTVGGLGLELGFNYRIHNDNDLTFKFGYEVIGDHFKEKPSIYPNKTIIFRLGYSIKL